MVGVGEIPGLLHHPILVHGVGDAEQVDAPGVVVDGHHAPLSDQPVALHHLDGGGIDGGDLFSVGFQEGGQSLSSLRSGAGLTSWPRRMLRTLLSDTAMPMAANRRTMPGAPTRRFSSAMRSTACTVSAGNGGRPALPWLGKVH